MPYFISITLLLTLLFSLNAFYNWVSLPFDFNKSYWFICGLAFIPAFYYASKEKEPAIKLAVFIMTLLFCFCGYAGLYIFGGVLGTAIIGLGLLLLFLYLVQNFEKIIKKINWFIVLLISFILSFILNIILLCHYVWL